jgi:hypothetical protein
MSQHLTISPGEVADRLAIHRRYTEHPFLRTPYCYLQGIQVRALLCNYNVIQSVSAVSRRLACLLGISGSKRVR